MNLEKLSLVNFRNYKNENFTFENGINAFVSNNGMGKSNLLESIYYLSYVRPFRQITDKELILKGEKSFFLNADYNKKEISANIKIKYNETKEIFFDNKKIRKFSDILGKILSVLFCNDDIFIVNGSPAIRRKFFNIFLSIIDKLYLENIKTYDLILKQKNILLKTNNIKLLSLFNEQLSGVIYKIQERRYKFFQDICDKYKNIFKSIGFFYDNIDLKYSPSIFVKDFTIESIFDFLEKNRKYEIDKGFSVFGPHRDNYSFLMNGFDFNKYASLGQMRLAALCLKIIQVFEYKRIYNDLPLLLLDDVILELDPGKQKKFFDFISDDNYQMFITLTDIKLCDLFKKNNIIKIENGKLL